MKKLLSIIIVTYNSERLIFDCLNSIYNFNDIDNSLEIIIVDNCSADCEQVFAKIQTDYPIDIVLIKNGENKGYGYGNNLGVNVSNAPYFIVMNPDVRLVEPIFQKILSKFNEYRSVGMMGVCFKDGSDNLYFKPEYQNLFKMIFSHMFIKFKIFDIENMYFSGSFLIFDKQSFIEAGYFDEHIFMYYEEADISNRIIAVKKKTLLLNDVFVLHLIHGREVKPNLLEIDVVSLKYYLNKYHTNSDKYISRLLFMFHLKYFVAMVLKNKIKMQYFKTRILICNKSKQPND